MRARAGVHLRPVRERTGVSDDAHEWPARGRREAEAETHPLVAHLGRPWVARCGDWGREQADDAGEPMRGQRGCIVLAQTGSWACSPHVFPLGHYQYPDCSSLREVPVAW